MAEFVSQSVAQIKNELENESIHLLTTKEKRKILKKREHYEYRVRKRTKNERDYLLYIQYEQDVLKFFKMRKKMRSVQSRAEVPVIMRIHRLYQLCETRFPYATDVWRQHIAFCKQQKEFRRVGRVYTEMLHTHGAEPELWVEAARWEVEQSNVDTARTLMQRCVATNQTSISAWVEFYKLELEISKLMRADAQEIDESDPRLNGAFAELVSKHAQTKLPESHKLLLSLIEVADKFPFAQSQREEMVTHLKQTFTGHPSVWDFIARRILPKKRKKMPRLLENREEQFFAVYEDAVQEIPTTEMWTLYLKSGLELLSSPAPDNDRLNMRLQRVLKMFERAADQHCLTVDMLPHWLTILRSIETEESGKIMQWVFEKMVEWFPHSVEAWGLRLQHLRVSLSSPQDMLDCLGKALAALPEKERWTVWEPTLLYLSAINYEHLESEMEKPCYSLSQHLGAPARLFLLQWTAIYKNMKKTREIFNKWHTMKPLTVDFYKEYIKQELMEDKVSMKRVRLAFENALLDYGTTDPDLWLEYMRVENEYGDPLLSGSLGTRALLHLPEGPLQERFFMKQAGLVQ